MNTTSELTIKRKNGKIWSYLRNRWFLETPEEVVRQEYLCILVNEYGFSLEQMSEEVEVTGHRGSGHARADFVIWRSRENKANNNNPLVIVECKSDNVTIHTNDYWQGDSYARLTGAKFLVTHNKVAPHNTVVTNTTWQ